MSGDDGFSILRVHFTDISSLAFAILIFLIFSSFIRLLFHNFKSLPESTWVIIVGAVFGGVIVATASTDESIFFTFDVNIFFIILVPPIIFEAGYFTNRGFFSMNIGMISLYAVLGTFLNALSVGLCLWGVSSLFSFPLPIYDALAYGSLISAVDPIAVLSIFESIHVNQTLYSLVFGESVLNDAVCIVLFQLFIGMRHVEFTAGIPFLSILKFFVVSCGGLVFGVLCGFIGTYLTKFSSEIPLLQPLLVFCFGYLSYLVSETVGMSGIMAILFCAMFMSRYVESNMNRNSVVTLTHFVKLLSTTSETLVFMYLGVSTIQQFFVQEQSEAVHYDTTIDGALIGFTLLFCLVWRFIYVYLLTWIGNFRRVIPVELSTQFILAYAGLRGAIAFALAVSMPDEMPSKRPILAATIAEVIFTIFVQGSTIKFFLKFFHIKREAKLAKGKEIEAKVLPKIVEPLVHGITLIGSTPSRGYRAMAHMTEKVDAWIQRIAIRALCVEETQMISLMESMNQIQCDDVNKCGPKEIKLIEDANIAHKELASSPNVNISLLMRDPAYTKALGDLMRKTRPEKVNRQVDRLRDAAWAVSSAIHQAHHPPAQHHTVQKLAHAATEVSLRPDVHPQKRTRVVSFGDQDSKGEAIEMQPILPDQRSESTKSEPTPPKPVSLKNRLFKPALTEPNIERLLTWKRVAGSRHGHERGIAFSSRVEIPFHAHEHQAHRTVQKIATVRDLWMHGVMAQMSSDKPPLKSGVIIRRPDNPISTTSLLPSMTAPGNLERDSEEIIPNPVAAKLSTQSSIQSVEEEDVLPRVSTEPNIAWEEEKPEDELKTKKVDI